MPQALRSVPEGSWTRVLRRGRDFKAVTDRRTVWQVVWTSKASVARLVNCVRFISAWVLVRVKFIHICYK
jgi:hypothetical protein